MFSTDIMVFFVFMIVLFLRQMVILKHPTKLNYAPLMIGVGVIGSVFHFITHPEHQDFVLLLRESSFPLIVSLSLYVFMNIMHQTVESEQKRSQHEFTVALIEQITQLKTYTSELEIKINESNKTEMKTQEEVRTKFQEDLKALEGIRSNQTVFLDMLDEMKNINKGVELAFKNFTDVQVPALDQIVHKHIDMLRISEQDHYNKLNASLQKVSENKDDLKKDFEEVKSSMLQVKSLSHNISEAIVSQTLSRVHEISRIFEEELNRLKSHSESLNMALYEGENKIDKISKESELLLKQMSLSSNKMDEMQGQSTNLNDVYVTLKSLMSDIEMVKADYVKSQSQLSLLSRELSQSQEEDIINVKEQMEELITVLTDKIDNSLDKLHQHYHITSEDLSQSVQVLAKKVQSQKGYGDNNV